MQYEAVILELMTRIKNLEDEVALLKERILSTEVSANTEQSTENVSSSPTQYQKMTDEMIKMCYSVGKKMLSGGNAQELADNLVEMTGMNRNSAIMYIYAVHGMLTGTTYKRAINAKAMKYYMKTIFDEYGSQGLKKAITASRNHIKYRREYGQPVEYLDEICNQFEAML